MKEKHLDKTSITTNNDNGWSKSGDWSISLFFRFRELRFCTVKQANRKIPKYKRKMNSAGTDFDNSVQNRFPHYIFCSGESLLQSTRKMDQISFVGNS